MALREIDSVRKTTQTSGSILLHPPPATPFSITLDGHAFDIPDPTAFHGFKLLPTSTPHFVAVNGSTGVWISFPTPDNDNVSVLSWDPEDEAVVPHPDPAQKARLADGVRSFDFDSGMLPYPGFTTDGEGGVAWVEQNGWSDMVAPLCRSRHVEKRSPQVGYVCALGSALTPAETAYLEERGVSVAPEEEKKIENSEFHVSWGHPPVPERLPGHDGSDVFENMDEALSDFAFAFVGFLLVENAECFERWKALFGAFAGSESIWEEHDSGHSLGILLRMIRAQLAFIDPSLFENISGGTALEVWIRSLVRIAGSYPALAPPSQDLVDLAWSQYTWRVDDGNDLNHVLGDIDLSDLDAVNAALRAAYGDDAPTVML